MVTNILQYVAQLKWPSSKNAMKLQIKVDNVCGKVWAGTLVAMVRLKHVVDYIPCAAAFACERTLEPSTKAQLDLARVNVGGTALFC